MTEQPPDLDDPVDPYADLGGLTRPTAYYGAIELHCETCSAAPGHKCRVFVERTQKWDKRQMPCVSRIKAAHEAGYI